MVYDIFNCSCGTQMIEVLKMPSKGSIRWRHWRDDDYEGALCLVHATGETEILCHPTGDVVYTVSKDSALDGELRRVSNGHEEIFPLDREEKFTIHAGHRYGFRIPDGKWLALRARCSKVIACKMHNV